MEPEMATVADGDARDTPSMAGLPAISTTMAVAKERERERVGAYTLWRLRGTIRPLRWILLAGLVEVRRRSREEDCGPRRWLCFLRFFGVCRYRRPSEGPSKRASGCARERDWHGWYKGAGMMSR